MSTRAISKMPDMDRATHFMAMAAQCRHRARLELDMRVREKLHEAALQYDARACASMMVLEDA